MIGRHHEDLAQVFAKVREGGRFDCPDCVPYEDDQILWAARGLRLSVADIWRRIKHFD